MRISRKKKRYLQCIMYMPTSDTRRNSTWIFEFQRSFHIPLFSYPKLSRIYRIFPSVSFLVGNMHCKTTPVHAETIKCYKYLNMANIKNDSFPTYDLTNTKKTNVGIQPSKFGSFASNVSHMCTFLSHTSSDSFKTFIVQTFVKM